VFPAVLLLVSLPCAAAAPLAAQELQQLVQQIALWKPGDPEEPLAAIREAIAGGMEDAAQRKAIERGMIALVTGGATPEGTAFGCRVLAQIGTEESVGGLLRLLREKQQVAWALHALEAMPYAAVDAGLLEALKDADVAGQVALVGVLGRRASREAAPALLQMLDAEETALVRAALDALAQIAAPEVLAVVQAKLSGWDEDLRKAGEAVLLAQAWTLHAQGKDDAALSAISLPASYVAGASFKERSAFIRLKIDKGRRAALFREAMRSGDSAQIRAAVTAFQQAPDLYPADAALDAFDFAPPPAQVALVDLLWRGGAMRGG
jgi:hypothetical protein